MPPKEDTFTPFEAALDAALLTSPWLDDQYQPDLGLLEQLVSVPVASGVTSETGRFPKAFDFWAAHELRRAGFGIDEVWPRASRPRVLPRDVKLLVDRFVPAADRGKLNSFLANHVNAAMIAPVDARVLGRVFTKQADVLIAHWARGVELLISTKTMVSSYGNNLRNRFEESYGDAVNLRGASLWRRSASCMPCAATSRNRTSSFCGTCSTSCGSPPDTTRHASSLSSGTPVGPSLFEAT